MTKDQLLKKLYIDTAKQMQIIYTFKESAELFFQYGVISSPENPYPNYQGSKYDYVLEKLLDAKDVSGFLNGMIGAVVFDLEFVEEGGDASQIRWTLKQLGFVENEEDGVWYVEPPNDLSCFLQAKTNPIARISIDNLPNDIKLLVEELNDNIPRKNIYACALLIRKIITVAVFIALRKKNKEGLLSDSNGNDIELSKTLRICQAELVISNQVMSRVTTSKWIGDSANHSYYVRICDNDVEVALTGLRLFLEEIFK